MLNPTLKKLLIINPTEDELPTLKMLAYDTVLNDLVRKVFQLKENEAITPRLLGEKEVRRFISNVKPVVIPIQGYVNEEISDMAKARSYLAQMGKEIYGDGWFINLLKNEIEFGEDPIYGIEVPSMDLIAMISKEMEFFTAYKVNYPKVQETQTKPQTKKSNKQTKEEGNNQ